MAFYIGLALASLIIAAVGLWLVRSLTEIGKTAYRTFLPSAHAHRRRTQLAHLNSDLQNTPSPWGWNGADGARHAALHKERSSTPRKAPKAQQQGGDKNVPWGWPGNDGNQPSSFEAISSGIEKSAAVTSVKNALHMETDSDEKGVGWPYRSEKSKKARKRTRHVGTLATSGKGAKPWGW